ncbi:MULTISPECIES: hypothetical protein [Butyricimonas]|uniref:hypothetical protein n=1 Tax=Butyricimonas TaxID=574697 RepID=UPI0007FB3BD6|nr:MULTISPECIES: hypothetical protein [Butyricimonas]
MNFDEERERRANRIFATHAAGTFGWWITLFYALFFARLDFDTYFLTAFLLPVASLVLFSVRLLFGFSPTDFDDRFSKVHAACSFLGIVLALLILARYALEWLF